MYASYALAKARHQEQVAAATTYRLAAHSRKARTRRRQFAARSRAGILAALRPRNLSL